ncbi:unnamed protein product [Rotaria socialis]
MEHNDSSCIHSSSPSTNYHLDYLDEFLKLICAPDLLTLGLFPNAKEITESYAVWAALRRFIFSRFEKSSSKSIDPIPSTDHRQNAIIVVGDGMTPRTAALCAYLTKGLWQCYSIDPILQYDTYADMLFINRGSKTTAEHCTEWKSIKGLRMVRAKIQTVSVQCRKAIVVMMHAHVTLEDAIAAIDATEGIIGIITCPCCNWAPFQQEWLGQRPHHHYADSKLLSGKNEMNVWYFPDGCDRKSSTLSTTFENTQLPTKQIIEHNIWGIDTSTIESKLSSRDGVKQRATELWPQLFAYGSKAFINTIDSNPLAEMKDFNMIQSTSNNSEAWAWATTAWSPKDVLLLIESYNNESISTTDLSNDVSVLPPWLGKPLLVVGTIGSMRRCKHTLFYELNTCAIPPEPLQEILRLTCDTSTTTVNTAIENKHVLAGTFPALLKTADRMWTCVEYQRHRHAVACYDATIGRKTKDRNSKTHRLDTAVPSNTDRINVVLPLGSYQARTTTDKQCEDIMKMKFPDYNPQPRESLFPWAMHLRPGDIIVAYCELVCNAARRPQLRFIDGILLFDSMLHMICAHRRNLQ